MHSRCLLSFRGNGKIASLDGIALGAVHALACAHHSIGSISQVQVSDRAGCYTSLCYTSIAALINYQPYGDMDIDCNVDFVHARANKGSQRMPCHLIALYCPSAILAALDDQALNMLRR